MAKYIFDTCCGLQLRQGCLVIAYLDLLGSLSQMSKLGSLPEQLCTVVVAMNGTLHINEDPNTKPEVISDGEMVAAYLFTALRIAFAITLLVGLHQNKRAPVAAYLVYIPFQFVSMVVIIIMIAARIDELTGHEYITLVWITITIILFLSSILPIYYWMVIRSQYYKMDTTDDRAILYRYNQQ